MQMGRLLIDDDYLVSSLETLWIQANYNYNLDKFKSPWIKQINITDNTVNNFLFSVWLALVALDSLTDAGPVPENRGKKPPPEVQTINKWLGVSKTSDILKDILEVAQNIKDIKSNKNKIKGNWIVWLKN